MSINKRGTTTEFSNPLRWKNSHELNEIVKSVSPSVFLSFSGGKDSLCSWIVLREYGFKVIPVFFYCVPDLSFQNEMLSRCETFFNTPIIRLPSPNTLTWLSQGLYQTPSSFLTVNEYREYIYKCQYEDSFNGIREALNMSSSYFATGVRMADGMSRRMMVFRSGGMKVGSRVFYPIFDFSEKEVALTIKQSGVKLPYDYALFGRTFDGPQYRFLKEIKIDLPGDYEKIKQLYPLVEVVMHRYGILNNKNLIL